MRKRILPLKFFRRPALVVARELLGKYLVCVDKKLMVTEVEVYDGPNDKASHASRGKTERNKAMFESGGVWYVYLCYGMYWMLNIVVGEKNYPAAILIRSACHVGRDSGLYVGPGKLTKYLKIDKRFNGQKADRKTRLYFEDRGVIVKPSQIKRLPRVGVAYAGPLWSQKKWRFKLIFPTVA